MAVTWTDLTGRIRTIAAGSAPPMLGGVPMWSDPRVDDPPGRTPRWDSGLVREQRAVLSAVLGSAVGGWGPMTPTDADTFLADRGFDRTIAYTTSGGLVTGYTVDGSAVIDCCFPEAYPWPKIGPPDITAYSASGGAVDSDASLLIDGYIGPVHAGDGHYIDARFRGSGAHIVFQWTGTPVTLTRYRMHQGWDDPGSDVLRSGWTLQGSTDNSFGIAGDPDLGTWIDIDVRQEPEAGENDSGWLTVASPGSYHKYRWVSDYYDAGGPLQYDWVLSEIEFGN